MIYVLGEKKQSGSHIMYPVDECLLTLLTAPLARPAEKLHAAMTF